MKRTPAILGKQFDSLLEDNEQREACGADHVFHVKDVPFSLQCLEWIARSLKLFVRPYVYTSGGTDQHTPSSTQLIYVRKNIRS
ncbi:hypothetical protein ACU8KH_03835 [Lachancea thermotolerans]